MEFMRPKLVLIIEQVLDRKDMCSLWRMTKNAYVLCKGQQVKYLCLN